MSTILTSSPKESTILPVDPSTHLRHFVSPWYHRSAAMEHINTSAASIAATPEPVKLLLGPIYVGTIIMVLLMFTVFPTTGSHLMFSQPRGRVYTSTLLSTLNGRESLRHDLHGTYEFGDSVNVNRLNFRSANGTRDPVAVKITVENATDDSTRFNKPTVA
ncbi:hypothetical protein C8R45DRAFT_938991 [Mycena sanguinolenta]|nr:hypothetical protein C8R45DRAFT_938991 [Mycena sanguinolenta]